MMCGSLGLSSFRSFLLSLSGRSLCRVFSFFLTLSHENPVREWKEKVPQCSGFVFQEAQGGTRVLDGLILDGEGWG